MCNAPLNTASFLLGHQVTSKVCAPVTRGLSTGEPCEYLHRGGKRTPSPPSYHSTHLRHVERDAIDDRCTSQKCVNCLVLRVKPLIVFTQRTGFFGEKGWDTIFYWRRSTLHRGIWFQKNIDVGLVAANSTDSRDDVGLLSRHQLTSNTNTCIYNFTFVHRHKC